MESQSGGSLEVLSEPPSLDRIAADDLAEVDLVVGVGGFGTDNSQLLDVAAVCAESRVRVLIMVPDDAANADELPGLAVNPEISERQREINQELRTQYAARDYKTPRQLVEAVVNVATAIQNERFVEPRGRHRVGLIINPGRTDQHESEIQVTSDLRAVLVIASRINRMAEGDVDASFSSLLLALSLAPNDYSQSIRRFLDENGADQEALRSKRFSGKPAELGDLVSAPIDEVDAKTLSHLRLSVSATRVMSEAERLRSQFSGTQPLDVRHVAGAYITDDDPIHRGDFEKYRIEPQAWSLRHLAWLRQNHPDEGDSWAAAHEERFGEQPQEIVAVLDQRATSRPFADIHNDEIRFESPDGRRRDLLAEDQLGIESHVRALSLLMSSTELRPPLAVGLFGDWGAGKTYFMRALRQEIDNLTTRARGSEVPQHELKVFRNIVQIEFNAWHYVDADLWASLGDFIFANLRIAGDDAATVQRRREELVKVLRTKGAALRQAETERRQLEDRLAAARDELDRVRAQRAAELSALDLARAGVTADKATKDAADELLSRLGVREVGDGAEDLVSALDEARAVAKRGNATAQVLAGRFGVARSLVGVLILLLTPAVLAVMSLVDMSTMASVTSAVVTAVGSVVGILRFATGAARSTLDSIEDLSRELNEQIEADGTVRQAKEPVDELEDELDSAQTRERDLRQELADLNRDLDELSPERQLADFIVSRRDSDDYRKHLGLASVIRRDFDELASLIGQFNRAQLAENEAPPEPTAVADDDGARELPTLAPEHQINRIILYIDDLDRCPPARVIDVLQAVHLLLAFPLFVVVVGVDARWLSRSLQRHYEGLLGEVDDPDEADQGASATPHDYLEKIFQIPFWLRPMSDPAKGRLLDVLTAPLDDGAGASRARGVDGGAPTEEETDVGHEDDRDDALGSDGSDRDDDGEPDPEDEGGGAGRQTEEAPAEEASAEEVVDDASDLRITPISITQSERDFMTVIAPLLGRSPRSLTRFVNVYRLVKAVEQHEGAARSQASTEPEVTMLLLAIVTGMPAISRPVFRMLASTGSTEGTTLAQLVARAGEPATTKRDDRTAQRQWTALDVWLRANEVWAERDVTTWQTAASRISRYSYRIEQL